MPHRVVVIHARPPKADPTTRQMPEAAKYWFPAKRDGWSWSLPIRWQGWVVLVVYLLLLGAGILIFNPRSSAAAFSAYVVVLSVLLLLVCLRTGEPPRWRWGQK